MSNIEIVTSERGRSILLMDDTNRVGVVGFRDIIGDMYDPLRANLGLYIDSFPEIWTIGRAFIIPKYRGRGYYPEMRNQLFLAHKEVIDSNKVLVIGSGRYLSTFRLQLKAGAIGMDFQEVYPEEVRMLNVFTPDPISRQEISDGTFYDSAMMDRDNLQIVQTNSDEEFEKVLTDLAQRVYRATQEQLPTLVPSIVTPLYVSSLRLALDCNKQLKGFRSPYFLIQTLRALDYFKRYDEVNIG